MEWHWNPSADMILRLSHAIDPQPRYCCLLLLACLEWFCVHISVVINNSCSAVPSAKLPSFAKPTSLVCTALVLYLRTARCNHAFWQNTIMKNSAKPKIMLHDTMNYNNKLRTAKVKWTSEEFRKIIEHSLDIKGLDNYGEPKRFPKEIF